MRLEIILVGAFAAFIAQISALEARPQQTPYSPPSLSDYFQALKASEEGQAGYSPASYVPVTGAQGSIPVSNRYMGTSKYPSGAVPIQVSPNVASTTGSPDEELLGPFSGIAGQTKSSIESSLLGKVTSLPASELSKVESSIHAKETSVLGFPPLNSSSTSSTRSSASSRSPQATSHSEVKEANSKDTSDKKSAAGSLLWGNGHIFAVCVIGLTIWLT